MRFAVAKKIVERAADFGIPAHDIVVDPLVMPIGAMATAGLQVFALVRKLREELGVNTTCGASNISFGLPNRHGINNAFLAMASAAGMTSAIMNPVAMPATKKSISERLDALKALGVTAPEDIDMKALGPLVGMATSEDLVRERIARLADLGITVPEDADLKKLGPLLGLGKTSGIASDEILSIRAADFLLDHDPSGGNWIRMNKPVSSGGGGRGGREGRRRRRG